MKDGEILVVLGILAACLIVALVGCSAPADEPNATLPGMHVVDSTETGKTNRDHHGTEPVVIIPDHLPPGETLAPEMDNEQLEMTIATLEHGLEMLRAERARRAAGDTAR